MRTSRLHTDQPLASGSSVELDTEASHYVSRVLRLKTGHAINLFNADDGEFAAEITAVDRHHVTVMPGTQLVAATTAAPGLEVHLGMGLSRGDRMDLAIQKSTELGVSSITPLYTEYCEVKLKPERIENKLRHWRRIIINAAEQCGRLDIPPIRPPVTLQQWETPAGCQTLMLEPQAQERLPGGDLPTCVGLLVGPEGGFSAEEIAWGEAQGFRMTTMGSRVLRTETAPVAALAILHHIFETRQA